MLDVKEVSAVFQEIRKKKKSENPSFHLTVILSLE